MYFQYETERLIIKILDEFHAQEVLDFYKKNEKIFGKYDGTKPNNYYSKRYQEEVLRMEYRSAIQGQGVRFYVYLKENHSPVIGTVSLQNILPLPYESGIIGYRFDADYHGKGYGTEAVGKLVQIGFRDLHLKRISAYVQSDNRPSIRLLERVGFEHEGIARSFARIGRVRKDHEQWAIVNEGRIIGKR